MYADWQVTPSAVIGHSSGEIAAAYTADALTLEETIIVAYYRGYICKSPRRAGGMAAVGVGKDKIVEFLLPGVSVACENSGSSVTLSGDLQVLETVMSTIKTCYPDILVRKLQVEMAYHSRKS